jgi:multidrug resistance efflux pump
MSKLISAAFLMLAWPALGGPLLTGVVEDIDAQMIEMPSLPGVWQRRVDWMVQEGSEVAPGDLVVRLDPGDLISREEQAKTDLLKVRLSAARRIDELKLELLDNERLLAESKSSVRLAELDATIPEATIPKLDYERYKLTLEIARKNFVLAQAELLNKRAELDDVIRESELEVRQAESNYQRIRDALKATEIHAEKAGFIVYGENRFTGRKVFPGETLYGGFKIASVASRQDLQIRFWIHEADILKVQDGQYISILADAQGATPFGASVTWTSSQAVQKQDWSESGYFEALARPTEGVPDSVMPGMSVMGEVMPKVND